MKESSSRGLAAALGWALGCGFFGALAQGILPAGATGLRLAVAAGILALSAFFVLRRVGPGFRWAVLAVVAGAIYGSVDDIVRPPRWIFAAGILAAGAALGLRQPVVPDGPEHRSMESRSEALEARAAAYRRAVKDRVST